MGAKFFRSADKPKKIRKRFSQTRSWFRTFKWVACKYHLFWLTFPQTMPIHWWLLDIHSRVVSPWAQGSCNTQTWRDSPSTILLSSSHQDQAHGLTWWELEPLLELPPPFHPSLISSLPTSEDNHSEWLSQNATPCWRAWRSAGRTTPPRTQKLPANITFRASRDSHAQSEAKEK